MVKHGYLRGLNLCIPKTKDHSQLDEYYRIFNTFKPPFIGKLFYNRPHHLNTYVYLINTVSKYLSQGKHVLNFLISR